MRKPTKQPATDVMVELSDKAVDRIVSLAFPLMLAELNDSDFLDGIYENVEDKLDEEDLKTYTQRQITGVIDTVVQSAVRLLEAYERGVRACQDGGRREARVAEQAGQDLLRGLQAQTFNGGLQWGIPTHRLGKTYAVPTPRVKGGKGRRAKSKRSRRKK